MSGHVFLALVLTFALACCASSEEITQKPNRSEYKKSLSKNCANSYSFTCFKLDVVSWVDKLSEEDNYSLLPGVSVVRENGSARASTADIVSDLAKEHPNDPEARLDGYLFKKVSSYLNSHSLKLKFLEGGEESEETGRQRGGKKKGGGMGNLLAYAAMMKGTLGALALGGIAAIAGKALMTGLMALMLSAIVGIKSLGGGGGKTTYEIFSKPIYSHEKTASFAHDDHGGHGGGYSSFGRSYDVPLPLGLQANYAP